MTLPERRQMSTLELVTRLVIVSTGALLVLCMLLVYMQMIGIAKNVERNRQIGCISRYLDHQQYAPGCDKYVNDFKENRESTT